MLVFENEFHLVRQVIYDLFDRKQQKTVESFLFLLKSDLPYAVLGIQFKLQGALYLEDIRSLSDNFKFLFFWPFFLQYYLGLNTTNRVVNRSVLNLLTLSFIVKLAY